MTYGHAQIVISPLICEQARCLLPQIGALKSYSALMQNQVEVLNKLKVRAAMLVSSTPANEIKKVRFVIKVECVMLMSTAQISRDLACGHPKTRLLYVTPERIVNASFQKKLVTCYAQNELARFCIDESHCISEWGQSERSCLLTIYSNVPISFQGSLCKTGHPPNHVPKSADHGIE